MIKNVLDILKELQFLQMDHYLVIKDIIWDKIQLKIYKNVKDALMELNVIHIQ